MPSAEPNRLCFEDTVIDFSGRRLWCQGEERPLEPKAFDVLALLAGAPGRVFSRDEILDSVWGHRHVTPGVLNRVMTLLRQALHEDAQHPRLLHTLHGVGYRFDLPPAPTVDPRPDGPHPSPPPPAEPAATGTRMRRAAPWLAASLVLGSIIAAFLLHSRSQEASDATGSTAMAGIPTIAVVPLKALGEADGAQLIADGLSEELVGSLSQIEGLRVIASTSTSLAAAESVEPSALAERLGITHLLEGSLQRDGEQLRVRLRLLDASGRALWARSFDRESREVLLLQREVAEAVAGSLALRLSLPAPVGSGGDAQFVRRYLAARALLERRDLPAEQSSELAESELRALAYERPDDARVHAGLALALEIRAQRKPPLAASLRQEALREAVIAMRLDPTLPEPYFVQGNTHCLGNEWNRCLAMMAKVHQLNPGHPIGSVALASYLSRLGYLARAEEVLREVVARDPVNSSPRFLLGRLLDTTGRHEEARRELARTGLAGAYARWFNAVWRGDYAAALQVAESEIGSASFQDAYGARYAPGYVAASRALTDPTLWPEAMARFDQSERTTGLWNFARVLAPDAPDHAADYIRRLDEVRQRGYSTWDLLLWTSDLAWLRRDPAFQDYLRDNGILSYWREHGFPPQCRPQGDGAVCD